MKYNVIIDADSMIYSAAFADELDSAKESLDSKIESVLDYFEEKGTVNAFTICSGSRGNFRKYLTSTYKANRKDVKHPEWLKHLHLYAKTDWSSKRAVGVETDDLVASLFLKKTEGVRNVIVSIDKDYLQLEGWIYNYNKNTLIHNSKLDALRAFYTQMIVGDSADNIKVCKGKGKAYASKLFKDCETEYQFRRRVFETYKSIYKSKARETYILTHKLLKLIRNVI
jgi:5'-3' exonuclease